MRISDWSSDVCSSDLGTPGGLFVDEFLRFHEAYICLLKSRYTPKLAVKAHPSSRRKPGPKNSAECRDGAGVHYSHSYVLGSRLPPGSLQANARLASANDPCYGPRDPSGGSRSDNRRGGKECVSTCMTRGSP